MENPEVPQANAYMLEAATNAVKEVASLGVDAQAANGQVAFRYRQSTEHAGRP